MRPVRTDGQGGAWPCRVRRWFFAAFVPVIGAILLCGCAAPPAAPDVPCPEAVGASPVRIAVRKFKDGGWGTGRGFGVMARPGVLWTVAHLLPDADSGPVTVLDAQTGSPRFGSGFERARRQVLILSDYGCFGGDWAEVVMTWLPDPDYGMEEMCAVAAEVEPGDRVVTPVRDSEVAGVVVVCLEAYDPVSRRRYPKRVVLVRFDDPAAAASGRSGSPIFLERSPTHPDRRFLGLLSATIEWPVVGAETLAVIVRPPSIGEGAARMNAQVLPSREGPDRPRIGLR